MRRHMILLVIALAAVALPAGGATAGGCENRNNNTYKKLMECVTLDGAREHQAALQAIADEHNGIRTSGTPGYDASAAYAAEVFEDAGYDVTCLLYTSPSPRDRSLSRMPSSA